MVFCHSKAGKRKPEIWQWSKCGNIKIRICDEKLENIEEQALAVVYLQERLSAVEKYARDSPRVPRP